MLRIVVALLVLGLCTPGRAAPNAVRLSFVGDPSTSMAVSWNAPAGTSQGSVEYGTSKGQYPLKAAAQLTPWSATHLVAEAVLKNLQPATLYYYRVGDAAGGFSPEYSFRTGPTPQPSCGQFRFVFVGDSRAESWEGDKGASSIWPVLAAKAASHLPAFFVHGGDIVYDGTHPTQWQNHLAVSSPVSALFPILYCLGNHDDGPGSGESANYNQLLQLPRAEAALGGSGTEDHYAFRFGNALFIALSTVTFTGGSSAFKAQADWMDQVLTQNPARWKFLYLHHPIYTEYILINHKPNEVGQNAALVPIINKHHVDVVVGSHNHFYERFVPSACSVPGSDKPCPVSGFDKGTVYITSGGAGAFPILFAGPTNAVRVAASGKHHFLLFEVLDHQLKVQALDDAGKPIDSFSISKPAPVPDPCLQAPASDGGLLPDRPGLADGETWPDRQQAGEQAAAGELRLSAEPAPVSAPPQGCGCGVAGPPAWELGVLGLGFLLLGLRRRPK